MKKNGYPLLCILLVFIFIKTSYLDASEINSSNYIEQYSTEQSKHVKFDKKKYNEFVKRILRTKSPSFLSSAANKSFKEFFYLCASGLLGAVVWKEVETGGNSNLKWPACLFGAVLAHTFMQVLFDYLFVSKDHNLENLEDFEKYVQQTLSSDEDLIKKNSDLILKLFEKDYGLISNKLDRDGEAGFIRKISRFLFKESILLLESGAFGMAVWMYVLGEGANGANSFCAGSAAGVGYFIFLTLIFDWLLAKSNQRLLKVEKLRDIDQFFEEIKMKKLELQHEHIASVV